MNANLAEARRQFELATKRVEDVVRCAGHSSAAWDATDAAERDGVPLTEITDLRLRLMHLVMSEWLPRAMAHVASLKCAADRASWYRGLAGAMRSGAGWFARGVRRGHIASELPPNEAMGCWAEQIEQLERAALQCESS